MISPTYTQSAKYFKETPDGFSFLDPVFGTELIPGEPPPSVQRDPFTSVGLAQLHKMAAEQRLMIQLVQGYHGGIEDLHDLFRDSGDVLPQAPLVAIEMAWHANSVEQDMPDPTSVEYELASFAGRKSFQEAQLAWLKSENKVALPCELAFDWDTALAVAFHELVELCWQAKEDGDLQLNTILFGCYQATRQWNFLAVLGCWLRSLDQKGQLPSEEIRLPFMSGTHRALLSKLTDYFNIPTESYEVAHRTLGPLGVGATYDEVFDVMTSYARVTHKQLEIPLFP